MNHDTSKMVSSIHEALVKCGAHDGMTLDFIITSVTVI